MLFLAGLNLATQAQNQTVADSLVRYYNANFNLSDSVAFHLLHEISYNHTNPDSIRKYSDLLIDLASQKSDYFWLYRGHLQKGNAFRLKGEIEKALAEFLTSGSYAKKAEYSLGTAFSWLTIADVYSISKNYNTSEKYYKKAIPIFESFGDSISLATAYLNLGNVLYYSGKLDSALTISDQAKSIFEILDYDIGIAYSLGNKGLVYLKKGFDEKAKINIEKATEVLVEFGDMYPVAVYQIEMAEIYRNNGKLEKALNHALRGMEISKNYGFKEQIRDAYLKLSELYAETKDFEKAYHFHTNYLIYRDSINNEEVIRKMADLRTEYEVSQKQAEIDLLTKQRQINKLIGLGLAFITVLVSILAFVLYRNNRTKHATNKILTTQKDELQRQHLKLEGLNNTKDRFFSIISHDLRGPVNAFNGISELIKHYIARNEMGQLREVSEYIDKSARQLSTLLDNLLDWSIKQQGAFPFNPEKIYLNPLLEEIVEIFGITAHAKKIMLTVNLEEDIYLWADRNSLLTIIRNLVNNALKFTEPEGLVTLSAYSQKSFAYINIIDTGIGIPEEKLETLFVLKDKTVSRGTSGEKGLGIGLSLAYEFALMNKGTIIVNSEENAGTIFTIKIPLAQGSLKPEGLVENKKDQSTFSSPHYFKEKPKRNEC